MIMYNRIIKYISYTQLFKQGKITNMNELLPCDLNYNFSVEWCVVEFDPWISSVCLAVDRVITNSS